MTEPTRGERRLFTRRRFLVAGGSLVVTGGVGFGGYVIYGHSQRFWRSALDVIPDHRVDLPTVIPRMVVARGGDPAVNVRAAIERLGGMQGLLTPDDTVLIKPNIGWQRPPEHAANTHPDVVAEIVRLCREAGPKRVIVTDCPIRKSRAAFEWSGIGEASAAAGAEVIIPEDSSYRTVKISERLGAWDILEPFVTATKIINVPVAKSHNLMGSAAGMKNWIGITTKLRYLFHNDIDASIAELALLMRPTLTVIDATACSHARRTCRRFDGGRQPIRRRGCRTSIRLPSTPGRPRSFHPRWARYRNTSGSPSGWGSARLIFGRCRRPRSSPAMADRNPLAHLRASDIRGIAQLAAQATEGVTEIAEGVHQSVWSTMGVRGGAEKGRTRGITGFVYRSVRGVTKLVGNGLDAVLAGLEPVLDSKEPETPHRDAVFAALNGVMGDHLVARDNPFAIPMTLRYRGEALDPQSRLQIPGATGKVLLLIHGLCMTDHQWRTMSEDQVVDHGQALASAFGYTPIHLRYNTGLHVSTNGRELSIQLEHLINAWPKPIAELAVVAHSMGGLLIRSAFHLAREDALRWPDHLKTIVFLGTPHHGAPLEKAGNWVDAILTATPYTAPFAKLGQLRSAGITDLRFGHVLDEDWQGQNRFLRQPDPRRAVPLPEGVACYTVAATTAAKRGTLADHLIGDGLVPLPSALGRHDDSQRCLAFGEDSQRIEYQTNHLGLLSNPDVTRQMLEWLGPGEKDGHGDS